MAQLKEKRCVSTTIKDSFFDDPFFKDWWNDFDLPMESWNKNFQSQISSKNKHNVQTVKQDKMSKIITIKILEFLKDLLNSAKMISQT